MWLYVHLSNSFLLNAMLIKVSDALQKQITIWIPYDNQSTLIYLMPNMHHLSIFRHLRKYCIAHDFKPWQRSKVFYLQNTNPLRVPVFKRLEMRVWFLPLEWVFVLVPLLAYSFYLGRVCDDVPQTRESIMQTWERYFKVSSEQV